MEKNTEKGPKRKEPHKLVGGLEHEFCFFHILGITIPTDELIFFRGVQTTNQQKLVLMKLFV